MSRPKNPWIVRFGPPVPRPRARVLAFPHAGGGASSFRMLAKAMPPDVELVGVQPPGREARLDTPAIIGARAIADAALPALVDELDVPVVLLGHSFGALIAYEVGRALARRGRPARLFVSSAHRAPDDPPDHAQLHAADEATLFAALQGYGGLPKEVLEHRELVDMILPTMRADLESDYVYAHDPEGGTLGCAIVSLVGEADPSTTRALAEGWSRFADRGFTFEPLAGDHFPHITPDGARRVAAIILKGLSFP